MERNIRIRTLETHPTESERAAIVELNEQLSGKKNITGSFPPFEGSRLFLAQEGDAILGMITVSIYDSLSGRKAWIEDFVVDSRARGKGVGQMLFSRAQEYARESRASSLNLTSSPFRSAAHAMYLDQGMHQRETDVFKKEL